MFLSVLITHQAASGANIVWDGDTSTDWSNAANWTTSVVPVNDITTDTAVFSLAAPVNQPSISGAVSVSGIDVQLAAGGFSLGGSGTLSLGSKGIDSTVFASGTLTIGVANIVMGSATDSSWSLGVSANTNTQATTVDLTSNIQLHKTAQLQLNSPRGGTGGAGTFNVKGVISNATGETTSGQVKYLGGSAARNTFNVTGLNTYTGNTLISQAVVNVNTLADEGTGSALGSAGTINIVENSSFGTLAYNGTQAASTNRRVTIGLTGASSTGQANIDNVATNAAHTLSFTNTASIIGGGTGNRTLGLRGANTGNNSFAPLIENASGGVTALRKEGAGKWMIANPANTYTGETALVGGTLEVAVMADAGTASSLGSDGIIRFNGGALSYTGAGASSNRVLTLGPTTAGATSGSIRANGTGALALTAATMNYGLADNARTLTLGGTSTQENQFATSLTDNGTAKTTLAKADAGRWTITGTNTHTGGLSLSGNGRLLFSANAALGDPAGAITFTGSSYLTATQGATIGAERIITLSGTSTASFGIISGPTTVLDVAAFITGTGAVNRDSGGVFTTGVVRYSNDANNFTGDFNTRYGTVEFTSVAHAGGASALGAGTSVNIANGSSTAVLRHIGAVKSTTTRNLVWSASTGPLSLESSGEGEVEWLGSSPLIAEASALGDKLLTLGGTNTGGNVLAQAVTDTTAGGVTRVTKTGAGTWTLTGTNSYTGNTTVEGGRLGLTQTSLADASKLYLTSGAGLVLGHTAADVIDSLYIDNVLQPAGVYGAVGSGAEREVAWITGTGRLSVTNGAVLSSYSSWIAGYAVGALSGFGDDPDGDGLDNGLENVFGGDPTKPDVGPTSTVRTGNTLAFRHPKADSVASDISTTYEWSTDLLIWNASGANQGGVSVVITSNVITDNPSPASDVVEAVATITGDSPKLFVRVKAVRTTP